MPLSDMHAGPEWLRAARSVHGNPRPPAVETPPTDPQRTESPHHDRAPAVYLPAISHPHEGSH
ncbi:hypothetical protein GCM10012286_79650 [Streptomyces lasiicapitis]|uniref:Uncharacterized protein n=1 Tax=Streptomyces lasiicapitis TaxID=1923961 RepID=A0ABQ2MWB5_9ACTN|nr:hypothetical protein GCM10012286_79650 [Streptomyces lasiicapitis]